MAAERKAVLAIQSGTESPVAIPFEGDGHVLGRHPHADVDLDNPFVSRKHAIIEYSDSGYTIIDLGSKNGTFVNGARLGDEPRPLKGGEIIEFGKGQVRAKFSVGIKTITLPEEAHPSRRKKRKSEAPRTITPDGIVINMATREVYVRGVLVEPPLTGKDYEILALLSESPGFPKSNAEIAARAWPERPDGSVTLEEIGQRIHRIRSRIEPEPTNPKLIETMRGFGYKLVE